MAAGPSFEATVRALDQVSPTLKTVRETIEAVGRAARDSQGELQGMERQVNRFGAAGEQFRRVSGHVQTLQGHFNLLSDAIGGAHSRLSNLLPALGGLASITSVAGIFHLVDAASERRNEVIRNARNLGITRSQLGAINYAAAVSDVDAGTVQTGVARLERNMSMAARGKDKDLAGLFQSLQLTLRDAQGHVRSVTDVLPDIADAIQRTRPERRQDVAQTFFGRGGQNMVGFLAQGGAALRQNLHDVEGAGMTTKTDDDFRAYNKSMVQLNAAVKGVTNTIAAILAPVLKPVVDMFSKWLMANRELIGLKLKEALLDIGNALKNVDWTAWGQTLRDCFDDIRWVIDHLGGLKVVLEGLIAIRLLGWVAGFVGQFARLAGAVGKAAAALRDFGAASKAGAAGEAAADGEAAAAGAGGAAAKGAGARAAAAGEGAAANAAEGAGAGLAARRLLLGSLRLGLPTAAFVYALDGGGLNEGERDLNSDPDVRRAYLRALPVPGFPGEKPGPAPTVRVTPEALPDFPHIVAKPSEYDVARQASREQLEQLLHVPGGGLPLDPNFRPRISDYGQGPQLPQLYPGGIPVPQPAPPAPPVRGEVTVTLNIPNMPSGWNVAARASGDGVRVRSNTGQNYPDGDVLTGW